MRKRLKKQGVTPATIVTDKLGSYTTAYITGKEGPFSPYGDEFEPRRLPPNRMCPSGGSSSDRKRSRPIRAFSATPHDGQRPCRTLAEDPGRTRPELRVPGTPAQTRIVSNARIRLDSRKSVRSFKGIICVDISEFESYMPSQAVRSLCASLIVTGVGSLAQPPRCRTDGRQSEPSSGLQAMHATGNSPAMNSMS